MNPSIIKRPEALCSFPNPALANMRCWSIRCFKNYVIFYRPISEGIEVIRVLHGGRDIERLFQE